MKKLLVLVAVLLAAGLAYLCFWPVPIEPVAWQAPEAPRLEGPYAPNDYLAKTERIGEGAGIGPETIALDKEGRIYGPYVDGRILRFSPDGRTQEEFANTGGRPLGLDFGPDGTLYVADAFKGLLAIDPAGKIKVLATEANGVPFAFTDDVDFADDGKLYFSDASNKFGFGHHMEDFLEHGARGRLLRYDPDTGQTDVLLDGLQFANGVATSPGATFVLVNETGSYRVTRYWLKGPKAGQHDIFFDNLPGIPDGISRGYEGVYWVALFSPRLKDVDQISDKPFIRKIAMRLPQALQPKPVMMGFALGLNAEGQAIYNLQDSGTNAYAPITSVEQYGDTLYLGSLLQKSIGRVHAP
jgi:sugar lactone lactonase YvrE